MNSPFKNYSTHVLFYDDSEAHCGIIQFMRKCGQTIILLIVKESGVKKQAQEIRWPHDFIELKSIHRKIIYKKIFLFLWLYLLLTVSHSIFYEGILLEMFNILYSFFI